jgi:outer membrane protein
MKRTPHNWRACLAWLAALWGAGPVLAAAPAQTDPRIVVAVLADGPAQFDPLPVSLLLEEAGAVLGGDTRIESPPRLRRNGGWTIPGINAALDALLADPEVDVVVAVGLISSNQAARRANLPKPVIAAAVADPVLEGYPLADGRSGRNNFTYIADFIGLKPQLDSFLKMTRARHLAAVVDELLLATMPELTQLARQLETDLGVRITLVPAGTSAAGVVSALPAGVDAVFVTPLLRTPVVEQQQLARQLQQRRLPSMAMSRAEVEAGLLMANTGNKADYQRVARRIALDIQRIHGGENAAQLEVALVVQPRLVINMQTARDIGFSPPWDFLTDAEQLNAQAPVNQAPLGLLDAMQRALAAAPTLQASKWSAAIARDDARGAHANLLPKLDLSANAARIDEDHASPLTRAEKTATRELSLSQVLYSDDAWAGYTISRLLAEAADASARATLLDTLQDSASAYLTLLRAQAVENVRRSNVELTRQNLETSRVREAVGLAERSDYLRWVSQLARDRSNLLDSEAQRRQAETELRRVLHLADEEAFHVTDAGLEDPLAFVGDPRTRAFMDTPAKWEIFERYAVAAARQQAPELTRSDAQVAAQERALSNAKRSFYIPDFALVGKQDDQFWRAGAGSQQVQGAPGEKSWSVMLQASIPLFDGGRHADLSRARHEVKRANAQRDATRDGVDARMRFATQRVGASYPAIELANAAAAAASENLRMVSDAYGRGIVSVTELIDAQEAALSAGLSAASARYGFLIDFVAVLRAMGDFSVLLDPGTRGDWYEKVNQWFITQEQAR